MNVCCNVEVRTSIGMHVRWSSLELILFNWAPANACAVSLNKGRMFLYLQTTPLSFRVV